MRRPLTAALLATALTATTAVAASAPRQDKGVPVVFVANAEGGTVTLVSADTFEVLGEIDVLPDGPDAQPAEDDPVQALLGQRVVEAAGGTNYAQDQDVSPDGRTLYVSRGHRGDVAAFDLATGDLLWKSTISGLRADHMTISPDGALLYVSALTSDVVEVLDAETGARVGSAPTGEWPHDNHVSADGRLLYNASIGNIVTPPEARALRAGTPLAPYVLTVLDRRTLQPLRAIELDRGIRPFAVTADGTTAYAQLSELHGVVEVDLAAGEVARTLELPVDEGVTEEDYSFEAPHHGLALTADESTLCLAGRASDYVALVATDGLEPRAVIDVGDMPSWAVNGPGDEHCFVANTGDGTLSVISYASRSEVARIRVGDGPKHLEVARVPGRVVAALRAAAR